MSKTINGLTVTSSAAAGDFLAIWRAANGDTRKITKANFMGGVLTGAGTIATGGFTLTVPATGTASLLALAQTYGALKTFNAGISFGQSTLSHYQEGSWTCEIADAASGGNVATVATQESYYVRSGRFVLATARLTDLNITGLTGANAIAVRGFPFASSNNTNFTALGTVQISFATFTMYLICSIGTNTTVGRLTEHVSGGSAANLTVSDLTSGTADVFLTLPYICQ